MALRGSLASAFALVVAGLLVMAAAITASPGRAAERPSLPETLGFAPPPAPRGFSGSPSVSALSPVGIVNATLVVANDTLVPGPFAVKGGYPRAVAYNPRSGLVDVADFSAEVVWVVDPSTNAIVRQIPVGGSPMWITVDPLNGLSYVSNAASDTVSVVNDSVGLLLATINVGVAPLMSVFDPVTGDVYVVNAQSGNVSIIDPTTQRVVDSVAVGSAPESLAVDVAHRLLYVGDYVSANVSIINVTTRSVSTVAVGAYPAWVTVDPTTGDAYVVNSGSSNVTVIDALTRKAVANVNVGIAPMSAVFDPVKGDVYVSNYGSANVSVISGTTHQLVATVAVGGNPWGLLSDPSHGRVWVANQWNGTVSAISDTTNTVTATLTVGYTPGVQSMAYDPVHQAVFVGGGLRIAVLSASTLSIVATIILGRLLDAVMYVPSTRRILVHDFYFGSLVEVNTTTDHVGRVSLPLAFGQNGTAMTYDTADGNVYLVNGQDPNVTVIDPVSLSGVTTISLPQIPRSITYDPDNGRLYVGARDAPTVMVVDPVSKTVVRTIDVGMNPWNLTYDPVHRELYVLNYFSQNLSVIDPATNRVVATLNQGLGYYPAAVVVDPVDDRILVANVGSDWVTVFDASTEAFETTISVGSGPYSMAFDPVSGYVYVANLFDGSVSVIDPLQASVVGTLALGSPPGLSTFPLGIAYSPANARLYVAGQDGGVSILEAAARPRYAVTFTESGLRPGTRWTATLNGTTLVSTNTTITFHEANGTYPFTVAPVAGYTTSPAAGQVTVAGADVAEPIAFSAITYTVRFTESGLPAATSWSVILNGTSHSSTTTTISFAVPNGTYAFQVAALAGFRASPVTGMVTVNGADQSVAVTWTAVTYRVTFHETGLPSGTNWTALLGTASQTASVATLSFVVPNGTYAFNVSAPGGYTVAVNGTPAGAVGATAGGGSYTTGTLTVSGSDVNANARFTPVPPSGISDLLLVGGLALVVVVVVAVIVLLVLRRRKPPQP